MISVSFTSDATPLASAFAPSVLFVPRLSRSENLPVAVGFSPRNQRLPKQIRYSPLLPRLNLPPSTEILHAVTTPCVCAPKEQMSAIETTLHDGNWYVLVAFLPPVEAPIVLAPGLAVRPLNAPITIFDLAAAGASGFAGWTVIDSFAQYCWSEVESAKDADITPGYDTLNRAWLVTALLILRGFTQLRSIACSAYSWSLVAGHQSRAKAAKNYNNLPPFRGTLLDCHLTSIINSGVRTDAISAEDVQWIRANFDHFNTLAHKDTRFHFALEAAIDWRFAKEPRSAVARLWSGIEALFAINSELVFRIAAYAASLLAPKGSTRKAKFDDVKKLYALRSKIVHGGDLPDDKVFRAASESFDLLRDLLCFCIGRGHVPTQEELDSAIFE